MKKNKRYNHYTCKLRILAEPGDMESALTEIELNEIQMRSLKGGTSLAHVISSLVKKSLNSLPQE